jgi:hypothetical protein
MALAIKMTTDPAKHPKPNATESSSMASLFASSVAFVLKFSLCQKWSFIVKVFSYNTLPPPNNLNIIVSDDVPYL